MVEKHPIIDPQSLESICRTIAATSDGLNGSQIAKLLVDSKVKDITPNITKWKRLYNAFVNYQNNFKCSNGVLSFIQKALKPILYLNNEEEFQRRRQEVNQRLYFIGYEIGVNGLFRKVAKSKTIQDSKERANRLKNKLENRNTHSKVFEYCTAELLVENYFHTVFEATKSIAERLRQMTGLTYDGNKLVDSSFSTEAPLIAINNLLTPTDRSEQIGFSNLIKGVFGLIRNSTAHMPKIKFEISEEMALDMLNMISYIHKKLDSVILLDKFNKSL